MAIKEVKNQDNNEQQPRVVQVIDYKDIKYLSRFISERGKIIPSRVNSQPIKRQREISRAIKRARILALMPFVAN